MIRDRTMKWFVGRSDDACYVEEREKGWEGEVEWSTEIDALEYAIICELQVRDRAAQSVRELRERLRTVKRATKR